MDNWGDPWADNADNADNARSSTKPAVTSPLPPTFAPAPALLNGFLDDAGWGNDDDSFGDWSAAPAKVDDAAPAKTSMNKSYPSETFEHDLDDIGWDKTEEPQLHASHDEGGWAGVEVDAPPDEEKVASESSDTSTTVQATEAVEDPLIDAPLHVQPDDDSSTRASTSPSETSRNDVPAESPRTSYEEERGAAKVDIDRVSKEVDEIIPETSAVISDLRRPLSANSHRNEEDLPENTLADEVKQNPDKIPREISDRSTGALGLSAVDVEVAFKPRPMTDTDISRTVEAFVVDPDLLRELFSPPAETQNLEEAPDDPIYSTSGRKAWYRLTRKQTMREYNNGNDDDNYIRVTWANSHIRSEVDKIVGRWAREDRISGTGPGARASFYWDTPAPTDNKATNMHSRQQTAQPASIVVAPRREGIPPLSTNAPAAFSWSSASAPVNPWHRSGPELRSSSSPIAPIQPATVLNEQQGSRVVSLNLTSHKPAPATGMQTLTIEDETPAVTSLISSPPTVNTNAPSSDPWAGLDTFDTTSASKDELVTVPANDEDEWGEMVSTPTVSAFTPAMTTLQPNLFNKSVSTPATPPQPPKSVVLEDPSPETMHAAPIVRLKSTISPTSALFKANSFVPLGVEQGLIGPGLLKSAKRVASVTKTDEHPPSKAKLESAPPVRPTEISRTETSDVFSARQKPVSAVARDKEATEEVPPKPVSPAVQELARPSTPTPNVTAPAEGNVDAWADADFSYFESSLPVAPPSQPKQSPSDAFSVFESPSRSNSSASSAKTFSRSPPRKVTPPPIQPLTGATSSAQRRKNEEDQIIHDILGGLPDLSYMLRR